MVQRVLGGETDAAEHLLAVPGGGLRRSSGGRLGKQAGQLGILGMLGGGLQGRLGALDRDERLGQSMTDRLK